jgi:hypothetical protein
MNSYTSILLVTSLLCHKQGKIPLIDFFQNITRRPRPCKRDASPGPGKCSFVNKISIKLVRFVKTTLFLPLCYCHQATANGFLGHSTDDQLDEEMEGDEEESSGLRY